jgi:P-type Ca2+ transporter type 2C
MTAVTHEGQAVADAAAHWYAQSPDQVASGLAVDPAVGLSSSEVADRADRFGPNRFAEAEQEPRWRAFERQYHDPMQIVLLIAGLGSFYPVRQPGTGVVLIALSVLNAVLGMSQEGKAAEAVAALQKMMIVRARIRRDGALLQVPAEELVPGDVVLVEAGDLVPADGRLIAAATLEVDESALTGESLPVSKGVGAVGEGSDLGDRTSMVYMNTNVTRGTGEFIVTDIGSATEVGHISTMLQASTGEDTPLTRQLNTLTKQILMIAGVAVIVSVLVNMSRGQAFTTVFTAGIAFAIAAIPTGLPAVVTAILSKGTQTLAAANAIVKRLRSAETLGSTSAINSDKTGTLTLNQMTAVEMALPGRRYLISGSGYATEGTIKRTAGQTDIPLEPFLLPMALCADAAVTDGEMIGDPTEGALVVLAEKGGLDAASTRERFPRVAELPFDSAYKLMATFHSMPDETGKPIIRCFVKGAPDQLLARAGSFLDENGRPAPADDNFRSLYDAENERLGQQGLRVMATARRDIDPARFDPSGDLLPLMEDLTLLTLVGIVDPPRPAAKASIASAHAAGIQVRMITGDHAVTAQAIARKLGIRGRAISGAEFGQMSDEELLAQIDDIGVIARVTPEHKVRLVDILKRRGHIVAMTGDGVNDAPALKKADIGIAMGITGTEVSKEAAAMILTNDDFATIVKAVELGRGLYDNLRRYIRYQIGALCGFVTTFLGASLLNIVGGIPFLPLQTIWVNFTTQVAQAIGLGYGKPAEGLMEHDPRATDEPLLDRPTLIWLATVGLVFGATTLSVIAWAHNAHDTDVARTMGMTTFAILDLLYAFTIKSERESVFSLDTFADRTFRVTTAIGIAAIVLAPELGILQRVLGTVSLTRNEWAICVVAGLSIIVVSEVQKFIFRRRDAQPGGAAHPVGTTTA